jgi:hypothetical protein
VTGGFFTPRSRRESLDSSGTPPRALRDLPVPGERAYMAAGSEPLGGETMTWYGVQLTSRQAAADAHGRIQDGFELLFQRLRNPRDMAMFFGLDAGRITCICTSPSGRLI